MRAERAKRAARASRARGTVRRPADRLRNFGKQLKQTERDLLQELNRRK